MILLHFGGTSTSNKEIFNNVAIKKKQPFNKNVPIEKMTE